MRAAGIGLALALLTAGQVAAQVTAQITLDAQALRDLAFRELQAGQIDRTLELTDALLARDPKDAAALILRSQALRAQGKLAEAEAAGRAAFAAADTMALKYGASLAVAQALSLQGKRTFAQIWLRRATHFATTEPQRARVAQDYAYVRSQNPLSLSFDASIQPSDNVNNGSIHAIWNFFGIPLQLSGDAQALSGTVGDFGVSGSYRLQQSTATYDALTFALSDHEVVLSPGARAQAPQAENGDYRYVSVEGGYQHRDLLAPDGTILTSEFSLGRAWYGSARHVATPACTDPTDPLCEAAFGPLSDTATLDFNLSHPYAPGATNFLHLTLQRNWRLDDPLSSANVASVSGGFSQKLTNGDGIRAEFGFSQQNSQDPMVDHSTLSATFSYDIGRPLMGVIWSGTLGATFETYPYSPFSATLSRQDTGLSLGLSAEVGTVSVYGFSPVITLAYALTNSNVDLYDTKSLGIGISVRSRF
jgi:tetratricopeptide (TPR) repeat protein